MGFGAGVSYAPALLVARLRAKKPAADALEAAPKAAAKAAA